MTLAKMKIYIETLQFTVKEHERKIRALENIVAILSRGKEPRK